jgi:hypothetical protein
VLLWLVTFEAERMTTGEDLDMLTSVLLVPSSNCSARDPGQVTDAHLIALERPHQERVGWLPALCGWAPSSLAYTQAIHGRH